MKIKAKEIAQSLGLSTATVSLALNDKPGVNEQTRKRVKEYLNSYRERDTEIPFVKWVVYVKDLGKVTNVLRSYQQISYKQGVLKMQKARKEIRLIYAYSEEELEKIIEDCNRDKTAGLILSCEDFEPSTYEILKKCRIPVSLTDGHAPFPETDVINFNNRQAVFQVMDYLRQRGIHKVVYLQNSYRIFNFDVRRWAYREYLEEHKDISGDVLEVGEELETIGNQALAYLEREKPEALFMENYHVSMGTVMACEKAGISIPEQVSLIGIDAMPETVLLPYELTHQKVPHGFRSGYAVELLLERLNGQACLPGREVLVETTFVEGDSVRGRS